ncbi:MAG: hypothetical protein JWO88_1100 [Frankiales bacterium]|jgi:hypothetical protein|nr:hypothetical protein [Frankiales bacterium]
MRSGLVLAHAFGQRYELPIPLWLFVAGGALVVAASFLVSARRDAPATAEVKAPDVVPPMEFRPVAGGLGILVTLLVAVVGLIGSQETAENIAPLFFWVLVWIAVPFSCGLIGDWTRPVNPFANLGRLGDRESVRKLLLARNRPLEWPARAGWWPAVALFGLLVLGELVFNLDTTKPAFVGSMLVLYGVMSFMLGVLFGPSWLARGEVFSGLFDAWGRLGFWRHGAPGRKRFAGGLDVPFDATPSRVVFVLLLLVSINFDGLLATPQWASYERRTLGSNGTGIEELRTASLVVLVLLVLAVFSAFAVATARTAGLTRRPFAALAMLLPSLVPIAFGYLVAHYLQYVLINGQELLPLLGNPGFTNWPLHLPYPFNDNFQGNRSILPNSVYWYVSVVVIVVVHVIAVFIANHRLRLHASDERAARRAEYPWLVAMVAYTAFSLFLIAQPLTQESGSATKVAVSAPTQRF